MIILDVSAVQDPASIDWGRARDEGGVAGGIVRLEYGTRIDAQWRAHADRIAAAGLPLGVYSFALIDADPDDEVRALCEPIQGRAVPLGIFWDIESRNSKAPGVITTWTLAACEATDRARPNYNEPDAGIYTGFGFWTGLGEVGRVPEFAKRPLWIANYGVSMPLVPDPWAKWKQPNGPVLWQKYGNTIWSGPNGATKWGPCPGPEWKKIASAYPVPGVRGEVDVNVTPTGTLESFPSAA